MKITISGLPGSGTSTLAVRIAKEFNLSLISAGETFRKLARRYNMTLEEFGCFAKEKPEVDFELDGEQKKIAQNKDNIILEGRLTGHLIEDADLKIWLKAPFDTRIQRIAKREGKNTTNTAEETLAREQCEADRYKQFYQIDLNDLSIYDIMLDTSKFTPEQTARIISQAIQSHRK